jgi:predicted aldo/keto reductase-like oxidoreductase
MRLPLACKELKDTNEAESVRTIRFVIDHGVNYLNLGYPHERLTRLASRALQDGRRQRIKIAASLPSLSIDSPQDFDRYLNQQLRWLDTDKIDFCLFGGLNRGTWPKLKELDALGWAESAVNSGRIGHLGFSFHDHFHILREILDGYDNWALGQFQYSYMDADRMPGVSGLRRAAEKGLAIVAAEPLLGGRLTKEPPESVARLWATAPGKSSPAERGLRWAWSHPEIATVVCDMSNMEQAAENLALADTAEPDGLTVTEEVLISRVRDAYRRLKPIPCTTCYGCMPCPRGIDIPRIFEIYNDAVMYDDIGTALSVYHNEKHHIDNCSGCGACADACGRKIAIPDLLKNIKEILNKI